MTYGEVYEVTTTGGVITVMYVGLNPSPAVRADPGDAVLVFTLSGWLQTDTMPLRVSLHEWTLIE